MKRVLSYKKPAFWVAAALLVACIAAAVCFLTDPEQSGTLQWARELQTDDIVNVELTVMPQSAGRQYRVFRADEIPDVVTLLNESRGRHIARPRELSGGASTLYITTADGVRHIVSNEGNVYLRIDGAAYKPGYFWLSAWPYTEGNAPLPEGFFEKAVEAADAGTGVMAGDRFYTKKWSIRMIGNWELGVFSWQSPEETRADLSVSRYKDLDGDIEVLEAYGETVEKLDGYYHCNYGWGSSDTYHSERYFYPIPDSGDYYDVTISWANVEAWEPGGA